MKKVLFAVLFVFCFMLAHATAADTDIFAGYPYKSATWKSKTTVKNPGETFSFEQTVYFKNKKMRTEGKFLNRATNEKENQVTIMDGKMVYSINPDKKQGMKYSMGDPANPSKSEIDMVKCRQAAKKSGSEKVNGVKCDKYEYACKLAGMEMKITEYRNDKGFAIRTVTRIGDSITTVNVSDLKINVSIPDSKFTPDKNIKFMDMQKFMSGDPIMNKKMKVTEKDEDDEGGDEDDDAATEAGQKMMKDMMKGMLGE